MLGSLVAGAGSSTTRGMASGGSTSPLYRWTNWLSRSSLAWYLQRVAREKIIPITAFISSPGDVTSDRNQVKAGMAKAREYDKRFIIEAFDSRDLRPGIAIYSQDVVNQQTYNCDIYVGLMETRFGRETGGGWGSGTEEEFRQALARFRQNPASVRILFYFLPHRGRTFDIDPEQFRKVKAFRSELDSEGLFFFDIENVDQLSETIARHISSLLRDEWREEGWKIPEGARLSRAASEIEDDTYDANDDEPGDSAHDDGDLIIDRLAEAEAMSDGLVSFLGEVSDLTRTIGEDVTNATTALEATESASLKKKIVDELAGKMITFSQAVSFELAKVTGGEKALRVYSDIAKSQIKDPSTISESDVAAILRLHEALPGEDQLNITIESLQSWQRTVKETPKLTSAYRKARNRMAATLGDCIVFVRGIAATMNELRRSCQDLLAMSGATNQGSDEEAT